jgi:molecular chaperone Hsp33
LTVPDDDLIRPFQIGEYGLRGRLVRLGPAIDKILGQHHYPTVVAGLLGEALALAALLAGALKYDGIFTLQTKGNGPIKLMVADITSAGALRGYAQYDAEAVAALPEDTRSVPRLLGGGHLAFTVDQGDHTDRYQGLVALEGATLAECTQHYFRQSEQIETGILASTWRLDGHWRAGGMMLQRLPPESGATGFGEDEDDAWRRALILLGTSAAGDLVDPDLGADALLFRLFHEDGVVVYPEQHLEAKCRCSSERIDQVLLSIPKDELPDLMIDGKIEVTCEFCGKLYAYDEAALDRLIGD